MAQLEVVRFGHPILKQVLKPVPGITPELVALTDDMIECMHRNKGVGLAANQVGLDLAVAVIEYQGTVLRMFNPVIRERRGTQRYEEGCLSVPGINGDVTRAETVAVEYVNAAGDMVKEEYSGHLARIVQHEVDHLNGLLILNHLAVSVKTLHKKALDRMKEETRASLRAGPR